MARSVGRVRTSLLPLPITRLRLPANDRARDRRRVRGIYSRYTGQAFASTRQTDIEHVVARSEAHDSGLCAADVATRRRFASDLLNLTLAAPYLNRHDKRDHDAAGWLPPLNRCWFANRVVEVRRKYDLTIDRHEADVLERLLSTCTSTELVFRTVGTTEPWSATSTD